MLSFLAMYLSNIQKCHYALLRINSWRLSQGEQSNIKHRAAHVSKKLSHIEDHIINPALQVVLYNSWVCADRALKIYYQTQEDKARVLPCLTFNFVALSSIIFVSQKIGTPLIDIVRTYY